MNGPEHRLTLWGILGGVVAATFAVWLLFFPDLVPTHFAWDVHPRMSQAFIGAGYVFRTMFFLSVALGRDWTRLRWMFFGNLAFTGTLLLATFFVLAVLWRTLRSGASPRA